MTKLFILVTFISLASLSCSHLNLTMRDPAQDSFEEDEEQNPAEFQRHHQGASAAEPDCNRAGWNDIVTKAQQRVINKFIASREHRLQHSLWHSVRGGLEKADDKQVITAFGTDWSKNHPLCPPPNDNANSRSYNPVGEDFLYMHREMIHMLQTEFINKKLKCVKGWQNINEIDSPKWKPPGALAGAKSPQALVMFKNWDKYFQDPNNLKQISLSQLGWAIEFTIHNNLHMRFANDRPALAFRGAKPDEDGAQIPYDGSFPKNWKYDDPRYNWLADPYSAAVNPVFWKIHGYVDHLIDLWLEANRYKSISADCRGASDCYQWRGIWTGSIPVLKNGNSSKGMTAGKGNTAQIKKETAAFNKNRLKLQRLGVVTAKDLGLITGAPNPKGSPPGTENPLAVARKNVCESN